MLLHRARIPQGDFLRSQQFGRATPRKRGKSHVFGQKPQDIEVPLGAVKRDFGVIGAVKYRKRRIQGVFQVLYKVL